VFSTIWGICFSLEAITISELSRLAFDHQWKNQPSFNDDAINGRLQITWSLLLGRDHEFNVPSEGKR